jgi:hypothetical protein
MFQGSSIWSTPRILQIAEDMNGAYRLGSDAELLGQLTPSFEGKRHYVLKASGSIYAGQMVSLKPFADCKLDNGQPIFLGLQWGTRLDHWVPVGVGAAVDSYTKAEEDALLLGKAALVHTHTSQQITDLIETVQDTVAAMMGGSNISFTYRDDTDGKLILEAQVASGGGNDPEIIRDTIGAAIIPFGLIGVTVNDAGDTIVISTTATQNQTDAYLLSRANHTGTQPASTITGLAAVATSGSYTDLVNKPTIPPAADVTKLYVDNEVAAAKQRANHQGTQPVSTITGLATVATSGSYTDLINKPTIPAAADVTKAYVDQENSNQNTVIAGKAAAIHGHISTDISDLTEAVQDIVAGFITGTNLTVTYNDAGNALNLTAAAGSSFDPEATRDAIGAALVGIGNISVSINDALDTITISTTATANSTDAYLLSRANHTGTQPAGTITGLAAVATSGSYTDLANKPTIPAAADVTKSYVDTEILAAKARANHTGTQPATTITGLATVATSGAYADLTGKPTIPAAADVTKAYVDAGLAGKAASVHNHISTDITDLTEAVQDIVAGFISGTNLTVTYNDATNSLNLTAAAGSSFDPEATRDAIGAALIGVGNIVVSINDAADTITISTTATANSTDAQLRDRSTHTGTQPASTITGLATVATTGSYLNLTDRPAAGSGTQYAPALVKFRGTLDAGYSGTLPADTVDLNWLAVKNGYILDESEYTLNLAAKTFTITNTTNLVGGDVYYGIVSRSIAQTGSAVSKEYVDEQNGLQNQTVALKADKTYVDSENANQNTIINGKAAAVHTHISNDITDLTEAVQDIVAGFITGTNLTVSYNDAGNALNLTATGGGVFDPEATRDAIGAALIGVGNIAVTINDAADTITIATTATQNSTDAYLLSRANHTGTQSTATISGLDDALNDRLSLGGNTDATPFRGMIKFNYAQGVSWAGAQIIAGYHVNGPDLFFNNFRRLWLQAAQVVGVGTTGTGQTIYADSTYSNRPIEHKAPVWGVSKAALQGARDAVGSEDIYLTLSWARDIFATIGGGVGGGTVYWGTLAHDSGSTQTIEQHLTANYVTINDGRLFAYGTGVGSRQTLGNATGAYSLALGRASYASGAHATTLSGYFCRAYGNSAVALGYITQAGTADDNFGTNSGGVYGQFASGMGQSGGGTPLDSGARPIIASGTAAFVHSSNNGAQGVGHGARAASSAILGGYNADIDPTANGVVLTASEQTKIPASITVNGSPVPFTYKHASPEFVVMKPGGGVYLQSPNGTYFKLTVSDAGQLLLNGNIV